MAEMNIKGDLAIGEQTKQKIKFKKTKNLKNCK